MWRILMVDDEELIRNSIGSYIEQNFDVELYRAASGYEAMSLLHRMRFDVVITDISMPVMDGIMLLKNIKNIWPGCYVIVLTVYDYFEYAYKVSKYERVDYVLKAESYIGIHNALEKALKTLADYRSQEERLLQLGAHIEHILPLVRNNIIFNLLYKRTGIPEQEQMDAVGFHLKLCRPVLLAVGKSESNDDVALAQVLSDFSYGVSILIDNQEINMECFFVRQYAVWLLQGKTLDEYAADRFLLHTRDAFEQATEMFYAKHKKKVTVALQEEMGKWSDLHEHFNHAVTLLNERKNINGLILFTHSQTSKTSRDFAGIGVDDLSTLWEFLQIGNAAAFRRLFLERLQPLCDIEDLTAALPIASVQAVGYLYLQLYKISQRQERLSNYEQAILNAENHITGSEWVQAILELFDERIKLKDQNYESSINNIIQGVQQYVREHFQEDIHLSSIAEVFHYSPSYLSRLYKELTGSNLSTYILTVRLDYAKRLLLETPMSVSDIGHVSGFYSVKYFNQVFKKNIGMTPSQYRSKIQPK